MSVVCRSKEDVESWCANETRVSLH